MCWRCGAAGRGTGGGRRGDEQEMSRAGGVGWEGREVYLSGAVICLLMTWSAWVPCETMEFEVHQSGEVELTSAKKYFQALQVVPRLALFSSKPIHKTKG